MELNKLPVVKICNWNCSKKFHGSFVQEPSQINSWVVEQFCQIERLLLPFRRWVFWIRHRCGCNFQLCLVLVFWIYNQVHGSEDLFILFFKIPLPFFWDCNFVIFFSQIFRLFPMGFVWLCSRLYLLIFHLFSGLHRFSIVGFFSPDSWGPWVICVLAVYLGCFQSFYWYFYVPTYLL